MADKLFTTEAQKEYEALAPSAALKSRRDYLMVGSSSDYS